MTAPFLGYGASGYYNGSCLTNQQNVIRQSGYPNWYSPVTNKVDCRAAYVTCCDNPATNNYCPIFNNWPDYNDVVHSVSPVTGVEVAYTS